MKKFWLLLCLTMLVCVGTAGADDPTEGALGSFDAMKNPRKCFFCGNLFTEAYYNATSCWYYCTNCDYAGSASHYVTCEDTKTCTVCGYAEVADGVAGITHPYSKQVYEHDAAQHWTACSSCGWIGTKAAHYNNCASGTACVVCGATDVGLSANGQHSMVTYIAYYDNRNHALHCEDCDAVVATYPHVALCTAPDTCVDCDPGDNPVSLMVGHPGGSIGYTYDDTWHYEGCSACGEQMGRTKHYVYCWQEDISECVDCHATGVTIRVAHNGPYAYNKHGHWWECGSCMDRTPVSHELVDNRCECGFVFVPGDASGDAVVNVQDAVAILEYKAEQNGDIDLKQADVTGDSKVDTYDALRILQYEAGWDVTLK